MVGEIDKRLKELGVELPEARDPKVAKILSSNIAGNILYVSGQVPQWNGEMTFIGKVGREFDIQEGRKAARLCALNVIAHAKKALNGNLDRVVKVAKIKGYVNTTPDLIEVAEVVNGASELFVDVFGEAGRHARTVAGVNVMPFDVAIEVEADFLISDEK
ncbi:MAG: RidA family protein [Rhodospirillaceae bacterium]|jgi:enamine deaminase RidA (YjgF/YER057c/UK114 family)